MNVAKTTLAEGKKMILTSDQQRALDTINASRSPTTTLGGHSGTGKTTLVPFVCEHALLGAGPARMVSTGRRLEGGGREFSAFGGDDELRETHAVVVTAPTNKAAKVIRAKLREAGLAGRVPCYTIHKANGLTMADDKEEKYLVKSGDGLLEGTELLIVDEASMVGERMFDMIQSQVIDRGIRVLFVGDPYQLPPVKDGRMQAFETKKVAEQLMLEQIVRQVEGHPVIALGDFFRRKIAHLPAEIPPDTELGADIGVVYLPARAFYNQLTQDIVANRERPGEVRALAWRNDTVNQMARLAREALYGEGVAPFVEGERLFTATPFLDMHTDEECTVVRVGDSMPHPEYPDFPIVTVEIELDNETRQIGYSPVDPFKVATEAERLRKKALHLQHRAKEADDNAQRCGTTGGKQNKNYWILKDQERTAWKMFHHYKGSFVDLRSVHAMTAHRSQGSTFDTVFVDSQDIKGSRDKFRLLYVACTRARNLVYIRES